MADLELGEGVARVAPGEWNALVGDDSPFLEWEWLATLEESGALDQRSGWQAKPLLLREEGKLVAACPLYVKGNSEGEFVFDWGWADAAYRAGIEYYPKLLVGVPFTPVAGRRILTAPGEDRSRLLHLVAHALRELCKRNDLSGVHVNFCRDDEREALADAGFLTRLGFQYHWANRGYSDFEDYLSALRSKRRNQVRRERRELEGQGVVIDAIHGDRVTPELAPLMFRIYMTTIHSNPWGRQYLNERTFELLVERFRHRLCFVAARQGEDVIAATINVQKGDAFYGRYWGCFQELRHLHFNVCYYAGIEHCIRTGLKRFEPGAGGHYKQLRGFDARPTWSCHYLADPRLSAAVERYLEAEREEASDTIDALQASTAHRRR